jgi:NitT/TauT family transport system substrate-binding protein
MQAVMFSRSIKRLAAVAALVAAGSGFGLPAEAQQKVSVKMSQAVDSVAYVAVDYAKLRGFYADEGIDLQPLVMAGGGPDFTALLSGDVEFNTAAPSYQLNGIRQDRKVLQVLNYIGAMNQSLVISKAAAEKSGVKADAPTAQRLKALKGMTIAITKPGAMTDIHMRFLLQMAGLEPSDVKLVAIGAPQAMISAVEAGSIDGFVISLGPDRTAVARGAVMWIDNLRGDIPGLSPFPMVSLYTMQSYAEKNPDVVRRVVRATQRATKEMSERSVDDIMTVLKPRYASMDPNVLRLCIEAFKPSLNVSGAVTREMAQNVLDFMPEAKGITVDQYLSFYTGRFLKD